jgi:hypothetical protein
MATPAQVIANQSNAALSTGPATADGKARVSQNATKLGLFSTASFVAPEEQAIFAGFRADWLHQLAPVGTLQEHIAREIIQAAWRMRRCANLEMEVPSTPGEPERAERLQSSIDRARATAHRVFNRCLNELRRIQTESFRRTALPFSEELLNSLGVCNYAEVDAFHSKMNQRRSVASLRQIVTEPLPKITKQTQSQPATDFAKQSQLIPRGAPCPCKSGEKYKRCCGKDAPPVLSCAA